MLLASLFLDSHTMAFEPGADAGLVPRIRQDCEMIEVATPIRSLKCPCAFGIVDVDERDAGREFRHAMVRQAMFHLAAEHSAIKALGLDHSANVQQEMVETEQLERRPGHKRTTS